MAPRPAEIVRTERDLLLALMAETRRARPELRQKLRRVTAELLEIENHRPFSTVPEHPEIEGHELRHWQK